MESISFKSWVPDADPKTSDLVVCDGLIPRFQRLDGFPSAVVYSDDAVTGTPRVLMTVQNDDGSTYTFAGTTSNIYRLNSGSWSDVGKVGGYTVDKTWVYDIYGTSLIATNANDSVQILNPYNGAGIFEDLAGSPPKAQCLAMYHDHLFLGNVIESGISYPRRLWRSKKGDVGDWTVSSSTGCGYKDIASWEEYIVALKPIAGYLLVYLTNSIWVVDEVGAPIWFSYNKIYHGSGPVGHNAIAQVDTNTHIYFGIDDIYIVSGTTVQPVGVGIRKYVFDNLYREYAYKTTHIIDRKSKVIVWCYPSTSGTGEPDKLLIFNYEEGRFSEADADFVVLGDFVTDSMDIDDLDTLGTIDDISTHSFDTSYWSGIISPYGALNSLGYLCSLSGTPINARVCTGEIDFDAIAQITRLRPIIQKPTGTITGIVNVRKDDLASTQPVSQKMNAIGLCNLRASGRYASLELRITGDHSGLWGVKYDVNPRGVR